LWPIWTDGEFRESDLNTSAGVVDRLLLAHSPAATIQSRVGSLMLLESAAEQALELESLLRSASLLHWKDAVLQARARQSLWINRIAPGFQNQSLNSIELVSWRSNRHGQPLLAWSGLRSDDDGIPLLSLDREHPETTRLEVQWKVAPKGIRSGSIDYK